MKLLSFKKEHGKQVEMYNSNFFMTAITGIEGKSFVSCMYVGKNGIVGYHQTTVPQLLLVIEGVGKVRGEEDFWESVEPGDAVFWSKGEGHETVSEQGMTAIVIEGEGLDPLSFMTIKSRE